MENLIRIICNAITSIALILSGLYCIGLSQYFLGTCLAAAGFSQLIKTIIAIAEIQKAEIQSAP